MKKATPSQIAELMEQQDGNIQNQPESDKLLQSALHNLTQSAQGDMLMNVDGNDHGIAISLKEGRLVLSISTYGPNHEPQIADYTATFSGPEVRNDQ